MLRASVEPPPAPSRRILLVDGENDMLTVLRLAFGGLGAEIATATSAAEALSLARARSYDMVLCDLSLTDLPAPELVRGLHIVNPNARIIIMGESSLSDLREECQEQGAVLFLAKPFRSLAAVVAQVKWLLTESAPPKRQTAMRRGVA